MTENVIYFNNFCRSSKARILRVAHQIGSWVPPADVKVWQSGDTIEIQHESFRLIVCPVEGVEVDGSVVAARIWVDSQIHDKPR